MEQLNGTSHAHWKDVESVEQAKQLIDYGVLLNWREMRRLKKILSQDDELFVVRHFAVRLAERAESRLPEEILIESVLVWLSNSTEEKFIHAFLTELLQQPNHLEACLTLVELSVTSEISNMEHNEELFAMAVALICEMGLAVQQIIEGYPEALREPRRILDQIATYLLSVSNTSNSCIRLSLLHYFGSTESTVRHKPGFNRIMGRFGHTVLEHLFTLLFSKKTEAVALQYLLENIPYILDADNHSQKILHETWKYYMLKKPERFALFIQTLTNHIITVDEGPHNNYKRVFLQHLGILMKVASEVNHKDLGRVMMMAIMNFGESPYRDELITMIKQDDSIRPAFRDQLSRLVEAASASGNGDAGPNFKSSKRGRKPSFARVDDIGTLHQVTFLGNQTIARAS